MTRLSYVPQNRLLTDKDLHTRNIVFSAPNLDLLDENAFVERLGRPETAMIKTFDGTPTSNHVPAYLVRPCTGAVNNVGTSCGFKIIDFGESFLNGQKPDKLNTPLVVRAPEAIIGDKIDHRVDMWSMACLV